MSVFLGGVSECWCECSVGGVLCGGGSSVSVCQKICKKEHLASEQGII